LSAWPKSVVKLGLHPDARAELEEAEDWYDLEQTSLGDKLVFPADEASGAFFREMASTRGG